MDVWVVAGGGDGGEGVGRGKEKKGNSLLLYIQTTLQKK